MAIIFRPMRQYMQENSISCYYHANQGIDNHTLHRIRHDKPVTTDTLNKLCKVLNCKPEQLIEYIPD